MSDSITKQFGPVTYSLDEYKFWHRFTVGKWVLSVRPDRENDRPRLPFIKTDPDGFVSDKNGCGVKLFLSGFSVALTHETWQGMRAEFELNWWNKP